MKVHYSVFYGWEIESKFDEEFDEEFYEEIYKEFEDFEVFEEYDTKYIVGKYVLKSCYLQEDIPFFSCNSQPPNLKKLKDRIYKQFPNIKLSELKLVGSCQD